MLPLISKRLQDLEVLYNIRILYASDNSNKVKFIYTQNPARYIGKNRVHRINNRISELDLDFLGYDLYDWFHLHLSEKRVIFSGKTFINLDNISYFLHYFHTKNLTEEEVTKYSLYFSREYSTNEAVYNPCQYSFNELREKSGEEGITSNFFRVENRRINNIYVKVLCHKAGWFCADTSDKEIFTAFSPKLF